MAGPRAKKPANIADCLIMPMKFDEARLTAPPTFPMFFSSFESFGEAVSLTSTSNSTYSSDTRTSALDALVLLLDPVHHAAVELNERRRGGRHQCGQRLVAVLGGVSDHPPEVQGVLVGVGVVLHDRRDERPDPAWAGKPGGELGDQPSFIFRLPKNFFVTPSFV